ncbi:hypothetical protein MUK42_13370 [Musa troglodytarum]|uniref:Terpene synthase N-terminal domain-containing protein n=1 Tax=Musa troglodytarum TaxID=320322 RepID=A0A9E7KFT6_9LILI|nr:hypothetical protein MUK42_13370 [Musa troglodytarum]
MQHETKGILSLYEASYVAKEGELVLDRAMDFTTMHLKCLVEKDRSILVSGSMWPTPGSFHCIGGCRGRTPGGS